MKKINRYRLSILNAWRMLCIPMIVATVLSTILISCSKNEDYKIEKAEALMVSVSKSSLELDQHYDASDALTIDWTTGNNGGTGASIAYTLEIDLKGNNFESAVTFDMGKAIYSKKFKVSELNNLLLNELGVTAGVPAELEVKVESVISTAPLTYETSNVSIIKVIPYKPVSKTLYINGSASPLGEGLENAIAMEPKSSDPTVFVYQGTLNAGELYFITTLGQSLPSYVQGATESEIVLRSDVSQPDDRFVISAAGRYKVTVDLLDLTIEITQMEGPAYESLFVVGDATSNGWNMPSTKPFVQNSDNLFEFTFEGNLKPGELKIATFAGGWCDGAWIKAPVADQTDLSSTEFIITQGCDGPDNKWKITNETAGRYKIVVNLLDNTITFKPVVLYIIGDAGPNGWNIGSPTPMIYNNGAFEYTGPLTAGEFKISKYKGDWCDDDWVIAATADQSVFNTAYKIRHSCEGDDFKWKLSSADAGNYFISIDLDSDVMNIEKQ